MQSTTKWIMGGVGALAISGLIYVLPAVAGGNWYGRMGDGGMLGGGMMGSGIATVSNGTGMMSGMMNGDMAAMHDLAAPLMSQMPAMHNEVMGRVSELLGMSTDELDKAMGEGLAQIARQKNVTLEDLQAVKVKGMNAFLDRLVAEKTLTREQADQFLTSMEKNMDACLNGDMGEMMGSGMMNGGGKHGH